MSNLAAYSFHFGWRALSRSRLRGFRGQMADGPTVNTKTLLAILSAARDTEIGRRFGFADIVASSNPTHDYSMRVPLRDYEAHADDIQSIARGGSDVLFPGAPAMFVATSGTSGDPKLLPTNRAQQLKAMQHMTLLAPAMRWEAAPGLRLGQRSINLMLASNPASRLPGGLALGMSSAGGMRQVLRVAPLIWTSPAPVFEMTRHAEALYLHALFGLLDESVGCIEAVFGTHIVSWTGMLLSRGQELVEDIASGTINKALDLAPVDRERLERQLRPDPARAKAVDEAIRAGDENILPRLWPQLRVLSTAVSGAFAVSLPRLRRLAGDEILICGTCFGATEGMLGVNLWPEQPERYAVSVGAAYFEFAAQDSTATDTPSVLSLDELRIGESYEIVVTNFAGLYRYRLGDIVRICEKQANTPVFEFDHRTGDVIDLAGEKTTQRHTQSVVESLAASEFDTPDAITNYTVVADSSVVPFRYRVYLELADDRRDHNQDSEQLAQQFDRRLQQINPSYRTLARVNHRLGLPLVKLVATGTFSRLEEERYRNSDGVGRNQVKVPRVLTDPKQIALLEKHVLV